METSRLMLIQITALFLFAAISALAQTNDVAFTNYSIEISNSPAVTFQSQTNPDPSIARRVGQIRADCIQNRRMICGKILKVLPDGLIVDSGYTNLMRDPLDRSWLAPGTVVASQSPNLVESKEPGSICVGLVFLTDYPKSRRSLKPKPYDYVMLEGYPAGQYTYTSIGDVYRTVRRFSVRLPEAVRLNFHADTK